MIDPVQALQAAEYARRVAALRNESIHLELNKNTGHFEHLVGHATWLAISN